MHKPRMKFGILGFENRQLLLDRLISRVVFIDAIFEFAYFAGHAFRVKVGVSLPLAAAESNEH